MTIVNFFKAKLHLSVDLNPKVNMSQKHDFETNEENIESIDFRIRLFDSLKRLLHNVWKCHIWIINFGIFHQFLSYLIETDLSGNPVWPQAWSFQKLAKIEHFWHL